MPSPSDTHHPVALLLPLLGLQGDQSDHDARNHASRLAQVASVWPIALVTQVIAGAIVFGAALADSVVPRLAIAVGVAAMALLAASLAAYAVLATAVANDWSPPVRTRTLALAATVAAAALLALLWFGGELPPGTVRLAALVACARAGACTATKRARLSKVKKRPSEKSRAFVPPRFVSGHCTGRFVS